MPRSKLIHRRGKTDVKKIGEKRLLIYSGFRYVANLMILVNPTSLNDTQTSTYVTSTRWHGTALTGGWLSLRSCVSGRSNALACGDMLPTNVGS